ncbi:alpha-L-arabinofuranosidase C-terminal domain-containing protein [Bacteroides sp. UBA939]|uniref:alpha-L-arabinofuranosidase C-terminal domain-containing protein n=1 Tax=Bacteroides sp. UBA939 TaxID=1946092 RepID=UPI0025BFEDE2|nr:alpha-L-arabinofuranosidase C-terminal domain-containing protein [Bacteroides sp. UBA939]
MKLITFLTFSLLLSLALPVQAKVDNEPDRVYLFSYSNHDGKSGLKFAWSPDGEKWFSVADGFAYVNSDFGPWGRAKTMFNPHLMQTRADGKWHCIWAATNTGEALAYVTSSDLQTWEAQKYFSPAERSKYEPKDVFPTTAKKLVINGREQEGRVQEVPYSTVLQITRYAEAKKYRRTLYAERTEQDPVRFANLKPVEATICVKAGEAKSISSNLIGIFFEDINYAADGGLYAELIQNRDFEYTPTDRGDDRNWNSTHSWTLQGSDATLNIATDVPIHPNNSHYAVFEVNTPGASLMNTGFDGIALKKGEKYDFSLFSRVLATEGGKLNAKGGKVKVALQTKDGREVAATTLSIASKDWKNQRTVLTATADAADAALTITPLAPGKYALDMISLFPQNTFKGRKNGLRADLAQTLADLRPRFVRFPGGCVAHGDGIDNIYDWKGSIGPLEARKPLRNLWGYHQTRGLGYHEYFLFCEDMGAEPVPIVAAGVPCQNSGSCAHHSHDELTCMGQQGGIPMEEMPQYIQDVLDLVEYANGDARKTPWGKKRAEAGHPKPFNLKYIGIGNEDMVTEVFTERFKMIFDAVREKYPEVTVIGTAGPFYEGTDYEVGWDFATELGVPMVDEHYYVEPGWLIHNQDYYDRYDRSKAKVYLGEYAAHLPGRPNNVETALAEALYLTAVERNGDIVEMTSYAPLLAKEGRTQWNPDLIYFNNTEVKPTVGYYTQLMYGENSGNEYLASEVKLNNGWDAVTKRVGVSVVKDGGTGDYIVKLVNMLPVEVSAQVTLDGATLVNPSATKTVLTGDPKDRGAKPVSSGFEVEGNSFAYAMPAYSFTVIRVCEGEGE